MEKLPVMDALPVVEPSEEHYRAVDARRAAEAARDAAYKLESDLRRAASWTMPTKDMELVIREKGLRKTGALDAIQAPPEGAHLIVLSGGVGCGKTTAASWWLWHGAHGHRQYARTGPPRFVAVSWFARHSRYEYERFDALERARALVVDDLGMEYADAKGSFVADLDALLDARYRNLLPTVLTTNLESDDFMERYGPRLRSRIHEFGCFINVNGPDLRRRGTPS
jgi:hypothetical protein